MLLALALSLRDYDSQQTGMWVDGAHYAILARSLVQSDEYGLIHKPGQVPADPTYPFGFPLLLAPFILLFPDDADAMKTLSLLAMLANAALLFWGWPWFSRRSHWWGLAVIGLYIVSPWTVTLSRMVLSDSVFLTLCLAALLLTEQGARGKRNVVWSLLLGIILGLVVFTRTIGLILVGTVFAYLLYRTRARLWKELILIVVTIACLAGLVLAITPVGPSGLLPWRYVRGTGSVVPVDLGPSPTAEESVDPLSEWYAEAEAAPSVGSGLDVLAFVTNFAGGAIRHLTRDLPVTVVPSMGGPYWTGFLSLVVFCVVLVGYVRWLRQEDLPVFSLFPFFYFGGLLLWSWRGTRLLHPIQPQLTLAFLLGAEAALLWFSEFASPATRGRLRTTVPVMVLLVVLLASITASWNIEDSRQHYGDLQLRTRWLAGNTRPSSIIMTEEPILDFFYGGRKSVLQPQAIASAAQLESFLAEGRVDYILLAPAFTWQNRFTPSFSQETIQLLPLIEELESENRLKLVHRSEQNGVEVYSVEP